MFNLFFFLFMIYVFFKMFFLFVCFKFKIFCLEVIIVVVVFLDLNVILSVVFVLFVFVGWIMFKFGILCNLISCLIGLCVGLFLLIVIELCEKINIFGIFIIVVKWIGGFI